MTDSISEKPAWTADQFWEYAGALVGEHEASQMWEMMSSVGLEIAPAGAALSSAESEQWQLIETYDPGHSHEEVTPSVLVVYRGVVSEAYYDGEDGSWWLANTSEHDFDACQAIYPTHWRPLPAPPSQLSQKEESATEPMIPGAVYDLRDFGPSKYIGIDNYHGETTHKFGTGQGYRYIKPDRLAYFLSPQETTDG